MNSQINSVLTVDYSKKNLQKASFKNENLANTSFQGSDLRGADFSGSDLTGADLTGVKTGITMINSTLIFIVAMIVSFISGYVAMVAGTTVQAMFRADDDKIRMAGILTMVLIPAFIIEFYLKGARTMIKHLLIPVILISAVIATAGYFSGIGSGKGILFLALSLILLVIMVIIGTIGRAIAGVLSSGILFLLVAMGGSIFGKSLGGGIGTIVLAISCAMISKRALSGAKGFDFIRKMSGYITGKLGTSFRYANLSHADFKHSKIANADFTNANISSVEWGDSKLQNCTPIELKSQKPARADEEA